jgi:hypothetical protein
MPAAAKERGTGEQDDDDALDDLDERGGDADLRFELRAALPQRRQE